LNQDYTEEDEEDELKVFIFYRGGAHAQKVGHYFWIDVFKNRNQSYVRERM